MLLLAPHRYGTSLARVTVVALGSVKPGAKRAECVVLLDELVSRDTRNPLLIAFVFLVVAMVLATGGLSLLQDICSHQDSLQIIAWKVSVD